MKKQVWRFAVQVLLLLVSVSVSPSMVSAADQNSSGSMDKPLEIWPASEVSQPDESTILLHYVHLLGGPREGMTNPSLTIYQDGHLRVFYPSYMKQSGTYVASLSPASLKKLWRALTDQHLLKFDPQKVRSELSLLQKRDSSEQPSEVQSKSDEVTTMMEFYPNRYQPSPTLAQDARNEKKRISWYGLKSDVMRYETIVEIQLFYAVCEQLDAIMQSDQLEQIP
ncbi:MAG: hypothetical protein RQ714_01895 [Nitrosomonas sp.]|nr:hypothetical protein [Nitrosomonas sp.]